MRVLNHFTCLMLLLTAVGLTGCRAAHFEHRFGTPVEDQTLSRFDGVWEIGDDSNTLILASRGSGWIEIVHLKQPGEGKGDGKGKNSGGADSPDTPPEPSIKLDKSHFMQIREFDGQYYAWGVNEDEGRTVYSPVKIASRGGRDLGAGDFLLAWPVNVNRFEQAVTSGELAGKVKDDDAKNVVVSSKPPALERFVTDTPLHEWIVLDKPVVMKRLSRENQ